MKKIIIFVLSALFILISFSVCDNNSNIGEAKKTYYNNYSNETAVRVGIYVYDYPMIYLSNNNLIGFDYDIMNEIAKAENLKLEYIQTQFSELIASLQNNIIDIAIAGISITEERKKLVSFSDKYYSSSQGIIVLKNNNNIKTFDDLIGKNVGVIKDTISDTIISSSNNINVVRFDIAGSTLLSLKLGNIEAAMLDRVTCNNYIKYDNDIKIAEDIIFPELDYGIAVRKDDNVLLEKINRGLNTIMSNGVYEQLIYKHLN
ncbi:transporter substrate-binding domain-containing protein [Brachyspira sp. G79]|uniref:transporter substrate-binding domain-containing protein n=1 Tax=Brachyspira sp. G79 TaxID=1358104 RepID=UPI000BBBF388|nr:transporter substrate-binding domain-containing protein [Brachyspira sp. G79]PCG20331.1 amino acid ABC transporter substrate-binding protein [Brachyspira sp. G79]